MRLSRALLEQLQEVIEATDTALTAYTTIQSAKIVLDFGDMDDEDGVEVEIAYTPRTEWTVTF